SLLADEISAIENRHPQIFQRPAYKRFWPLLLVAGTVLYLGYALWFFSLPLVLRESHWERLPLFLSQWISYDLQPEFRLDQPEITPKYPRFSALGENPDPDWVIKNADGTYTVQIDGDAKSVTFDKTKETITANGLTVPIALTGGKPVVTGPVPDWVTVHDDEIVAKLGFAGEVRVTVDRVKVRKRFLGWANFVFDTRSPFFGKPYSEVIS
ncbi:phosphonate ABC transporter, permease protein PhnE, partial [Mesorhizobium sp. M2A.F.Ca.ET.040.01.1.1]